MTPPLPRPRFRPATWTAALGATFAMACSGIPATTPPSPRFDLLVRNGTVYDGSGGPPRVADVGVRGDRIAAVGDLAGAATERQVDARGMALAPGFVNMLSWATESLLADGRAMSDLEQGVTLGRLPRARRPRPRLDRLVRDDAAMSGPRRLRRLPPLRGACR